LGDPSPRREGDECFVVFALLSAAVFPTLPGAPGQDPKPPGDLMGEIAQNRGGVGMPRILLAGVTILFCSQYPVCAGAPDTQSDEEITKLLVGKWLQEYPAEKGLSLTVTIIYQPDGTFSAETKIFLKGEFLKLAKWTGTWQVRKGEMTETTKTSDSIFYEVGMTWKSTILSITDQKVTIRTEGNRMEIKTRVQSGKMEP
jgi:hypothetical protein